MAEGLTLNVGLINNNTCPNRGCGWRCLEDGRDPRLEKIIGLPINNYEYLIIKLDILKYLRIFLNFLLTPASM
jgi:hypothetical protein